MISAYESQGRANCTGWEREPHLHSGSVVLLWDTTHGGEFTAGRAREVG